MKVFTTLGLILALSPAAALAQTTAPDTALPPHPSFAAMEQMHAQMEQLHQQARLQILAALTPAHRALLASVVGQLAIAPNPDRAGAARTLDAALTQTEGRTILSVVANERTQSHSMMEAARQQFEASLTADQRAQMQTRMESREQGHSTAWAGRAGQTSAAVTAERNDPGVKLLELAAGGGHDRMFMTMHGPGGPPPPQ
jgi:hypothetical protein